MPAIEILFVLTSFLLCSNCLFAPLILRTHYVGVRMRQAIKQNYGLLVLVTNASLALLGDLLDPVKIAA